MVEREEPRTFHEISLQREQPDKAVMGELGGPQGIPGKRAINCLKLHFEQEKVCSEPANRWH
jgi:hypothetical protein